MTKYTNNYLSLVASFLVGGMQKVTSSAKVQHYYAIWVGRHSGIFSTRRKCQCEVISYWGNLNIRALEVRKRLIII